MTCFFPLHAYKTKSKTSDKNLIVFSRPREKRPVELDLPCGQCIGCRKERTRQWGLRCMHEASLYEDNCFLTLTYDDQHLPIGDHFCDRCVVPHVVGGSVCVSDFQDFMKRLRKHAKGQKIRFLHCGEYGEVLSRPHYHALLFNYDFDDKQFFSERNGNKVYTSPTLSSLWSKGFAVIGSVSFESASYVSGYALKKVTGERAEAHYRSRKPEYITMSRRPGIGKGWYEKFKADVYPRDRVIVRGFPSRPPRAYDNWLGAEDPSLLASLKIKREKLFGNKYVSDVLSDGRQVQVSDSCGMRLLVKEQVARAKISMLKRPLEGL